jgi:hypothetical protein
VSRSSPPRSARTRRRRWWPAGRRPGAAEAAAGLAGLADHSLLTAIITPNGTRYRVLETIRQYGAERLTEADELTEAHARHLRWCLAGADALGESLASGGATERAAFDQLADELRAALDWAAAQPAQREGGHRLAIRLAALCFARGLPGEAQRRYEQAAALAAGDLEAASALHDAASAAEIRTSAGKRSGCTAPVPTPRSAWGTGRARRTTWHRSPSWSIAPRA